MRSVLDFRTGSRPSTVTKSALPFAEGAARVYISSPPQEHVVLTNGIPKESPGAWYIVRLPVKAGFYKERIPAPSLYRTAMAHPAQAAVGDVESTWRRLSP